MSLINHYNNDDVLVRNIIAGLLDLLNNQISYIQTWSNEDREKVDIAWIYNLGSSGERFMQDYYTFFGAECGQPKKIDGNFDYMPRGVLTLNSVDIINNNTTNRFVKGIYNKEINGKLETFSSYLYSIPLSLKLSCEMWVDSMITTLKIQQSIIETFFKTQTFYYYFRGLRLGAQVGFSDTIDIDKTISYSFDAERKIKLTFNLEVETYQPVFDKTMETPINNNIKSIGLRLHDNKIPINDGVLTITNPSSNSIFPKGIPIIIDWVYKDENAILQKVDISYDEQMPGKLNNNFITIESGIINNMFYIWNIPEDFTGYKEPNIIYNNEQIGILEEPIIKIIPDLRTKNISEQSFKVIKKGTFITNKNEDQIPIIIELENANGKIEKIGEAKLNIINNEVDKERPVILTKEFKYPGKINYKKINLKISNYINKEVFSIIRDIIIV